MKHKQQFLKMVAAMMRRNEKSAAALRDIKRTAELHKREAVRTGNLRMAIKWARFAKRSEKTARIFDDMIVRQREYLAAHANFNKH